MLLVRAGWIDAVQQCGGGCQVGDLQYITTYSYDTSSLCPTSPLRPPSAGTKKPHCPLHSIHIYQIRSTGLTTDLSLLVWHGKTEKDWCGELWFAASGPPHQRRRRPPHSHTDCTSCNCTPQQTWLCLVVLPLTNNPAESGLCPFYRSSDN